MTDLPDDTLKKIKEKYHLPDSSRSVGWTRPNRVRLIGEKDCFSLESGASIREVDVEYETYGTLNERKDNAIIILHTLSGDAHAAGWDAAAVEDGRLWRQKRPGWWDNMIGPGKAFDTNKYYIICSNVLGGCYGTTGPASINVDTGKPYGLSFPVVTVGDWVRLQERLIRYLGIEKLYAAAGGSLGGQQALGWALAFPEKVEKILVLAASDKLSAQGVGFNAVARNAIMTDPNFNNGNYYGGKFPDRGLAVARMLGHITYLSEESMHDKFGRKFKDGECPKYDFVSEFEVEGYLDHQGQSFVQRFDANSYLYISRAMDYYDASTWGNGCLDDACSRIESESLLVSFSSDWLYPPSHTKKLAMSMIRNRKHVNYINLPSSYGHDAVLLETGKLTGIVEGFLSEGESR